MKKDGRDPPYLGSRRNKEVRRRTVTNESDDHAFCSENLVELRLIGAGDSFVFSKQPLREIGFPNRFTVNIAFGERNLSDGCEAWCFRKQRDQCLRQSILRNLIPEDPLNLYNCRWLPEGVTIFSYYTGMGM